MKKLFLLGTALAMFSCEVAPAFATTSTVNPNVPAQGSALSSSTLRANFLAAYNDITNLWASLASLSASLAPSATIDTTNASNISTGTLNSSLLPTVNSNTGAFGSSNAVPVITLDGKGRVTAASTVSTVGSFNGRSGSVSPISGDYTVSQVTGAAPLASPTFTGSVNGASATWSGTDTALNFSATGTGADTVPVGAAGQAPTAANGMLRYDSTLGKLRTVISSAWQSFFTTADVIPVASGGTGATSLGTNLSNAGSVLGLTQPVNPLGAATSYTVLSSDMGKLITHTSSSAVAVALPQAGATGFASGQGYCEINNGSGTVTITPTTSTINGGASLGLTQGQFACTTSDGSNWNAMVSYTTTGTAATFNATSIGSGFQLNSGNGLSNPGTDATSIAIGASALASQTGTLNNIGIGQFAGSSTTVGGGLFIGYQTGYYATSGTNNVFVGNFAGQASSGSPYTGTTSTAVGYGAFNHPSGAASYNTAFGSKALGNGNPFTGSYNAAVGYQAGYAVTTGQFNSILGEASGIAITTGSSNTILGQNVAPNLTTGGNNTVIGNNTSCVTTSASASNEVHICAGSSDVIKATGGGTPSTSTTTIAGSLSIATPLGVASGGTNSGTAGITSFNNITGYTASAVPYTFAQAGVPVIIPSSGSIGNNGALTLTTALPATNFTNCYMYFPANAIFSGSAAGIYYTVMSSTTAGTIYNNVLSSGVPSIIASPTAFSTTGPGAYTQNTSSSVTLVSIPITANSMGKNGQLFVTGAFLIPNNSNTKTTNLLFGGSAIYGSNQTTQYFVPVERIIGNMGATNSQFCTGASQTNDLGINGASPVYTGIDTTSNQNLNFTAQLGVANDYIILGRFSVQIWQGS